MVLLLTQPLTPKIITDNDLWALGAISGQVRVGKCELGDATALVAALTKEGCVDELASTMCMAVKKC